MIEKLECNCIKAYKTRNMRDPNCCACSCDHNDLVEQLAKANERVKELEKELANKELLHVGFTNGTQVKYAKDEEGAFYPDTDGDCYIPLYMLKSHEHRIETTSIEQLRKEQEKLRRV
jgi:hypothetical protein